eukprot:6190609-Pleurochrysis_carterae.AAC.6
MQNTKHTTILVQVQDADTNFTEVCWVSNFCLIKFTPNLSSSDESGAIRDATCPARSNSTRERDAVSHAPTWSGTSALLTQTELHSRCCTYTL